MAMPSKSDNQAMKFVEAKNFRLETLGLYTYLV